MKLLNHVLNPVVLLIHISSYILICRFYVVSGPPAFGRPETGLFH